MAAKVALLFVIVSIASCQAATFEPFAANVTGEAPDVVAALTRGGEIVLRWQNIEEDNVATTIGGVAERLNALAFEGLRAGEVSAKKGPDRSASIKVRDEVLLHVSAGRAASARSSALGLAELWAKNIRKAFVAPYVMVREDRVRIPPGEKRAVRYGGWLSGNVSVKIADGSVATLTHDPSAKFVEFRAVSAGGTQANFTMGVATSALDIEVRKWAAQVSEPIGLSITGPALPNQWLLRAAKVAVRQHVTVEPGARSDVNSVAVENGAGTALISAAGTGYFSFERQYNVQISRVAPPAGDPARVVLSNEPERVMVPQVLAKTNLGANQPTNFLWHHVGGSRQPLNVLVRLSNSGSKSARVHVIGADGGPSSDELFTGHAVMKRFFDAWRQGAGSVFELPAQQRCELSRRSMPHGLVVSGLAQLTLLEGDDVSVECVSIADWQAPLELEPLRAALSTPQDLQTLELPGHKTVSLTQQVGKAWGFLHIGKTDDDAKLHPRLRGEYGVVHHIEVTFENPGNATGNVEIALRAGGGAARGVLDVNGRTMETGLLVGGDETILYTGKTNGANHGPVKISLIPQSGSNYPMTLIARSFIKQG